MTPRTLFDKLPAPLRHRLVLERERLRFYRVKFSYWRGEMLSAHLPTSVLRCLSMASRWTTLFAYYTAFFIPRGSFPNRIDKALAGRDRPCLLFIDSINPRTAARLLTSARGAGRGEVA